MSCARPDIPMNRGRRSRRSPGPRRRGVVLILVVALLGVLFVAGAALLSTVTFSTKTLDAEKQERQTRTAMRTVESVVDDLLRQGFIAPNGHPYSIPQITDANVMGSMLTSYVTGAEDYTVTSPVYGEIPGVQTYIDRTEPEQPRGKTTCTVPVYSNLDHALNRQASVDPATKAGTVPEQRLEPLELDNLSATLTSSSGRYIENVDADGDGIPDSYAVRIPNGLLPSELVRDLADRLRDPNYAAFDPKRDPDALYISLKVVPHGAMANVNAHIPICPGRTDYYDVLLASLLGYTPDNFLTSTKQEELSDSYLPEAIEWALRNRGGCVVPRGVREPASRLMDQLAAELLEPHAPSVTVSSPVTEAQKEELLDPSNRRWWMYDPSKLDNKANSTWRTMMDPASGVGVYDLSHTLTTVSYDDQLIRSGQDANGVDWITQMKAAGTYEWVNYPAPPIVQTGDPRQGRLKFSFPHFSKQQFDGGWLPNSLPSATLTELEKPANASSFAQLVRILQDAFGLVLRNYAGIVDFNQDGTTSISPPNPDDDLAMSITASMLAANLIDYADADDVPTEVTVRDWRTGVDDPSGIKVYGLERQPYITEIYAKATPQAAPSIALDELKSVFAVELYNPYDTAIDLAPYKLTDLSTDDVNFLPAGLERFTDEDLASQIASIPPQGYAVFVGFGKDSSGNVGKQVNDKAIIDSKSVIALTYTHPSGEPIVVDEVKVSATGDMRDPAGLLASGSALLDTIAAAGESEDRSLQRDMTDWRFPVPRYTLLSGANTLDNSNTDDPQTVDDDIRSVDVELANTDHLRTAFPTTGSMLLLMRQAHLVKPDGQATTEDFAFNHIEANTGAGSLMALEYKQIDNGRMPVFDEAGKYHMVASNGLQGAIQGVEGLPWGQLVFDYFTALPLSAENPCDGTTDWPQGNPPVDQAGMRVAGRININAAPYSVLAGLPLVPMGDPAADKVGLWALPSGYRTKIQASLYGHADKLHRYWSNNPYSQLATDMPTDIGVEAAYGIVAYATASQLAEDTSYITQQDLRDYGKYRGPMASGGDVTLRRGYGFLTVGELLNVRHPRQTQEWQWPFNMDGGVVARRPSDPTLGYVHAVARMVALGDWVTTKSDVFTIYGTIRGQFNDDQDTPANRDASLREIDQRAIRFQTTVNRLPMIFGADKPARIGSRIIGNYADVRDD